MNKFIMALLMVGFASSAHAQYYGNAYPYDLAPPVPGAPSAQYNVYPAPQQTIINKQYIKKQVNIYNPVPAPICTTYPDPWDTLGYIFGDPIMITVCQ